MEVHNGEIWQAREPLQELLKEPWPVKTAYWLAKLARKVNEEFAIIEQTRAKLFQRYGAPTADGKELKVERDSENWGKFVAEHDELMEQTVELPVNKIVLPSDNGYHIQPATLMALDAFVEVAE